MSRSRVHARRRRWNARACYRRTARACSHRNAWWIYWLTYGLRASILPVGLDESDKALRNARAHANSQVPRHEIVRARRQLL